jgi:hypothetical protein
MKYIKKFEIHQPEKYWKVSTKNNFKASLIKLGMPNKKVEKWCSDEFKLNNPKIENDDQIFVFNNDQDGWCWENLSYLPDNDSIYMGEIEVDDEEAKFLLASNKYNL